MDGKRLTISDIARMAQTSTATVSHYLNGKYERMSPSTRERVAKVVSETGYVPSAQAKGLARRHSQVIAVLILNGTNHWAGEIYSGIERVALEAGYQTVICNTHFDPTAERAALDKMLSLGVDGFIIQPTSQHRAVRRRLEDLNKPFVFFDYGYNDMNCTWVRTDLYEGVYDAITACVEAGYEHFVMVAARALETRSRIERTQSMVDALAEHKLSCQKLELKEGELDSDLLARQLDELIDKDKRTLVFCPHQWALGRVVKALQAKRALIPERIGILGINGTEWSDLVVPQVSTVVEPIVREGELACKLLLSQLDGTLGAPVQHVLPCETRWLDSIRKP